jgi:hypothetical protein
MMTEADVRAAMLMKPLCSYAWVRDTYGDALPQVPWIIQARGPRNHGGPKAADALMQRPTGTGL